MSAQKSLGSELQSILAGAFGERYHLREHLGTGAYGVVFRARDAILERDVAIKQVRLDNLQSAEEAEEVKLRTQREAKMTAKLRHEGIVAVHDILHTDTCTLIIMEFVDGKTLEDVLREKRRLGLTETVEILERTASALDHAHSQGVVHRDIKPANLMITIDDAVKIADFGIAKSQSGTEMTSNITASGNVIGTPYYMAPEQARGDDELDGRSDLFSLGCVAYECLAGRKPFRGKSVIDVLLNIVHGARAELDCEELELHPDAARVLTKALAMQPSERFQTARELVAALRAVPRFEPSPGPVVTKREPGASSLFDDELYGSLGERGAANVIRSVQVSGKSGILHLSNGNVTKRLYFLDGSIVFANSDVESERLGQLLIAEGIIDDSVYQRASRTMKKTRSRLGRTLVALGNLQEDRLDAAIDEQIQRIIYSIFGWESGEYQFESIDKPVEDDLARPIATDEVVLEGVRTMATESTIRNAIGDPARIIHVADGFAIDDSNVTLTSSEGFILSRIDGRLSIADIVSISPLPEDATYRCIYGLVAAGILSIEDPTSEATARASSVTASERAYAEAWAPPSSPTENDCSDAIVREIADRLRSMDGAGFYDVLEVKPGDDAAAIKKSYYALAKKYHPDRHSSCGNAVKRQLEEILGKLAAAYDVLSDSSKRHRYDLTLSHARDVDAEEMGTVRPSPSELATMKFRAARRFFDAKDYHAAVENLREAVRLDPSKLAYHKLLGQALNKNPNWRREAEQHLRRVVAAEPYDRDCYLELATIYEEGGLSTRARNMYERVVSLDPENELALNKLGYHGEAGKKAFFLRFLGNDPTH